MTNIKVKKLTYTAMFAAIAIVLMFFDFPLPFMPPFLKVDLSGIASTLAGLILGPISAILVTLVKDIIHLFFTTTGGVGQLADFICTGIFSVVVCIVYRKMKNKKGMIIGCGLGIIFLTITGMIANKFLLIPFYSKIMPIDAIISTCATVNPLIGSIDTYILFGAGPFNILKGIILSILSILLYFKLSTFINSNLQKK